MKRLMLLAFLSSCTQQPLLEPEITYKKTLQFSVNGNSAKGIYSAPKKNAYHIEIVTPQKPNLVKVTSCHQEKIFIRPGKTIEFDYVPNPDIEAGDLPCQVEISALDDEGKNQWGLIDFQLPSEDLKSKVYCNGEIFDTVGSSVCQSRYGLIQSIEFENEVTSYSPQECNKIDSERGKKFYLTITEGSCFYLFSDKKGGLFRLVTFGYNEALLDD
jgi:hypothetical protein